MQNNMQADEFISLDVDTSCAVREVFQFGNHKCRKHELYPQFMQKIK